MIIQKTVGLRVTSEQELEGLDITVHGRVGLQPHRAPRRRRGNRGRLVRT
ncbi:MAG: ammonium transporter [Gemmatimonadaceae bacterium]|nr:ammonium transporter [Gemmatimonadaceae bacterium]